MIAVHDRGCPPCPTCGLSLGSQYLWTQSVNALALEGRVSSNAILAIKVFFEQNSVHYAEKDCAASSLGSAAPQGAG